MQAEEVLKQIKLACKIYRLEGNAYYGAINSIPANCNGYALALEIIKLIHEYENQN